MDSFWHGVAAETLGSLIAAAVIYFIGAATGAFGVNTIAFVLSIVVMVAGLIAVTVGAMRQLDAL